MSLWNEFKECF